MDNNLKKTLDYDAFLEAEKSTGKSYKESEFTEAIGIMNFFQNNQKKDKMLQDIGDSTYSTSANDWRKIVDSLGFKTVLETPFHSNKWNLDDTHYICWHEETGSILTWETYRGESRNSAKLYFNWMCNDQKYAFGDIRASGSCTLVDGKYVLIGNIDAREAFMSRFADMLEQGKFVTPWVKRPWLWLLNYDEGNTPENYKKINATRILQLPNDIQVKIGNDDDLS